MKISSRLVDYATEQFGADRLMCGSDWPVAVLAGDYAKVWNETNKCLAGLSADERDAILRRQGQTPSTNWVFEASGLDGRQGRSAALA